MTSAATSTRTTPTIALDADVRVQLACRTTQPHTVTPGVLDDRAVVAYTLGQCHALTLALAAETGWMPALVIAHQSPQPRKSWATLRDATGTFPEAVLARRWVHVAVGVASESAEAGTLQYLDIEGLHRGADLARRWSDPLPDVVANGDPAALIVPVTSDALERIIAASWSVPRPDVRVAATFVPVLRARAGV